MCTGGSAAEGFGLMWERTLDEVPLDDIQQARAYHQLLAWAKSDELFTPAREENILRVWRETVDD